MRLRLTGIAAILALCSGLHAASAPALADDGTRGFLHISDIHLDPFTPFDGQAMSHYGEDTDYALFASSLRAIADTGAKADFAVVTGDLLAHDFQKKMDASLGRATTLAEATDYAARTTVFVAGALAEALPGKPVILALGNNDSGCGDYRIDPGGAYLQATREIVRRLAGADLVAADFDATYTSGGYYAMRHPAVADVQILVINDVLWSAEYQDACGYGGLVAAQAMMRWLSDRLAEQRKANRKVWLVHHIPIGIDAFGTLKSKDADCRKKAVPFLAEPFASQYPGLLRDFAGLIQANLTGHVHFDGYRLLLGDKSEAMVVEKIAPAISPIFGQNPAFHRFDYDGTSGAPVDFTTIYLANLATAANPAAADWRVEYRFSEAYGEKHFDASAVAAMWKATAKPGVIRDRYQEYYDVGSPKFDPTLPPAFFCAIGNISKPSFADCYCGSSISSQ